MQRLSIRTFLFALLCSCLVSTSRAQEYSVNAGEIRFDGTLVSLNEAKTSLVLNVVSFTLPSGKSSKLAVAKPKTILLSPATTLQVAGKPGVQAASFLQAGAALVVVGKDSGSGKDFPARAVWVSAPEDGSTPAGAANPGEGADPNEVVIRAGETRFDGKITGILSTTNFITTVFSSTDAKGQKTDIFSSPSKTVLLQDTTLLRSRGDAARKLNFSDLKIGLRVTFVGKDTGGNIKAREIAVWEADNSTSESIGVVRVSMGVSLLLNQADQAYSAKAYEETIRILNRSLQAADGANDRPGRGLTLDRLASVYGDIDQAEKAFAAYEGALSIWRATGDSQNESTTLNNLGLLLAGTGQMEKAATTLERAVQLARKGDPRGLALSLQNLAEAYSELEKNDLALEALIEALPVVRRLRKGPDDEGVLLARIARLYGVVKKPEEAVNYAQQAAPLIEQMRDKSSQAAAIYYSGVAYLLAGRKPQALELYKRALVLYTELGEKEDAASMAEEIASLENPGAPKE